MSLYVQTKGYIANRWCVTLKRTGRRSVNLITLVCTIPLYVRLSFCNCISYISNCNHLYFIEIFDLQVKT